VLKKGGLLLILAAVLSFAAGAGMKIFPIFNPDEASIKQNVEYDEKTGTVNILIVGVDEIPGEKTRRSDTIAVASLDIEEKTIRIISIPRDTRVQIPERGWEKLNHAFAYGGVELLHETVVNLLGIPIQYYAIVNYDSFPKLVDLIGGVDINVNKHLRYTDRAGGVYIDIPKGQQHMDGKTALDYVRFRHDAMGDIGRVDRQQRFYRAVFQKMKEPEMLSKIPEILKQGLEMVDTNMTVSQAIQLVAYLKDIPSYNTVIAMLPGRSAYIAGVSYWIPDLSAASELLTAVPEELEASGDEVAPEKDTLAVGRPQIQELVARIEEPIVVLNGTGQTGLAGSASRLFQSIGVDVAYIGNAKHFDYHYTSIRYPDGSEAASDRADALAQMCGLSTEVVRPEKGLKNVTVILGKDYEKVLDRLEGLTP
jgi:LCP family protein required for cell wall assembly